MAPLTLILQRSAPSSVLVLLARVWLVAQICVLAGCGAASGTPAGASDSGTQKAPVDSATVRNHSIPRAAFGPLYGSGCPGHGACGCGSATGSAEEFNCQLDHLVENDIPISAYLFDGNSWSLGSFGNANTCSGAEFCSWGLGDQVIERLTGQDVRAFLHWWGGCHADEQYDRAASRLRGRLLGFYLDDGSSDDDVRQVSEFMESVLPGDWENVAKAFQNSEPSTTSAGLREWSNAAYVGDLSYDFWGLKAAVTRVLARASDIPAPFAEFTGYAYLDPGIPEETVYYRRLHFGALQPVMAHTPFANCDPWRAEYGPDLLPAYRYWAWLHRELAPYFHSYAELMSEDPTKPVLQQGPSSYSFLVGREIFVPLVTEPVDAMDIVLPSGDWIDYWDETRVVSGRLSGFAVPLGREPVFIRQGALIPLDVVRDYTGHGTEESGGSLTLLVYPSGASSFRYRPFDAGPWITFDSSLSGSELTLRADPGLPNQPILYRVSRWHEEPRSLVIDGATVRVNQGGFALRLGSEVAVNASHEGAWYYDSQARRLVIKVVP